MNHWPFIAAAYIVTVSATAALLVSSFTAMRRAEMRAERLLQEKP